MVLLTLALVVVPLSNHAQTSSSSLRIYQGVSQPTYWLAYHNILTEDVHGVRDPNPLTLPTAVAPRNYAADELFELTHSPTSDSLTIDSAETFARFELVSATGAPLADFEPTILEVSGVSPGLYFVRALRGGRYGLRRFVSSSRMTSYLNRSYGTSYLGKWPPPTCLRGLRECKVP